MAQPRTTEPPQKKQKLSPDCTDQKSEDRELIAYTEEYVKKELAGQDGSHDFFHIIRVRNTALQLAEQENNSGNPCNMLVVELAALLHDIKDWKYSGSETAGVEAVREFLQIAGCKASIVVQVVYVVEHVGFKGELGRLQSGKQQAAIPAELAVVQDADRLDAIGAIGIARTFAYGGARGRALYDPNDPYIEGITQDQYKKSTGATINHFYEKLLKLKDLMKTNAGRRIAEERHRYMEGFLQQFMLEWQGHR